MNRRYKKGGALFYHGKRNHDIILEFYFLFRYVRKENVIKVLKLRIADHLPQANSH